MKRIWLALLLSLMVGNAFAQQVKSLTGTTCPGAGCLNVDVAGQGSVGIQITGTFVGTLQFEQTLDSSTFATWPVTANGATSTVTSATSTGLWFGIAAGVKQVQVRFSAYTSGTAVVNLVSTQAKIGLAPSIALSMPNIFSVSGSPGNSLAVTLASQSANSFFAAPNGSSGTPSFRAMLAADLPALKSDTTTLTTADASNSIYAGVTSPSLIYTKNNFVLNQVLAGATRGAQVSFYYKFAPTDSDASGVFRMPLLSYLESGGSQNLGSDLRAFQARTMNMNTGDGSINASSIYGGFFESFNGHAGGTSTGGKTTRQVGLYSAAYQQSDNAVNVPDIRGLWTIVEVDNGSVVTAYGHYNTMTGAGTVTTGYGNFINNVIGTTKWSYYNNAATAPAYSASNWRSPFLAHDASSVLTSASTITPTNGVHHVSGTTQIDTITVPTMCAPTCAIYLIPDAVFTTSTGGNISMASVAVVNKALIVVWDGAKWNPSY